MMYFAGSFCGGLVIKKYTKHKIYIHKLKSHNDFTAYSTDNRIHFNIVDRGVFFKEK